MIPTHGARVDMHCHSTASQLSKLGIQNSLGLPECATPPDEVYELAKRRGMDFVTITDHDTIAGCLELADRDDTFISVELTAGFRGEPQLVHVLCYGITPDDHEWLQTHADDVETCAAYLHEHEIACALAHPFYSVEVPLLPRHRRRLAELFAVWEVRNGSRARELNQPAAVYVETHGGIGIGGSDDHAGVDIGRTFTQTPAAAAPEEFLAHVRAGRAEGRGEQGSAAKWAHSAIALAARVLADGDAGADEAAPDPDAVLRISKRVVSEGSVRTGESGGDLGPDDARALLRAWTASVGLEARNGELVALMQEDDFSHAALARRARNIHERRLAEAVEGALGAARDGGGYEPAIRSLFTSCVPVVPYVPAATFLGREKAKLTAREGEPRRVALVVDAAGSMHGVTRTLAQIRERGVPGYDVEVIGTDPAVDRRLPAVAEVEMPFYAGLGLGIPSVAALTETIAEGRYELVHLASPGPAGVAAALIAHIGGLPTVGSYHTELAAYAALRSGDSQLEWGMRTALALFYGSCEAVLSPSLSADRSLAELGIEPTRILRWSRGVDTSSFDPALRDLEAYPGELRVLYAGRLTKEKGVDLLAESFLRARRRDPRLHLLLAGGGPEEEALRQRLGDAATFLGWLEGEELGRAYASADLFLFCSETDTFGQVIIEAQASGLPVVAVDAGGPASLIRDRETGRLCPADPEAIASTVLELAASEEARGRLAWRALADARGRTPERALGELASGYSQVLEWAGVVEPAPAGIRRAA
jgi:glycosyltransferase involved in cell wall biosynthesis/predicted metal-dependent phosphoesterase TrpH